MDINHKLILLILILTVLISACSEQPEQKSQPATFLESTASGAPPTDIVATETLIPVPSPTEEYLAVGYKLEFGSPFTELERYRTPNIKEEIFFGSTAGGGDIQCALPQDGHLPAITWRREPVAADYSFCLAGFPDKQETVVEIYAPDGRFVSSKTLLIDGPEEEKGFLVVHEQNGFSAYSLQTTNVGEDTLITDIRNDTRLFVFSLWFTAVGIPPGSWRVTATSGNKYAEVQVEVQAPDNPTILTLPDYYFDPFEDRPCRRYSSGDKVVVIGTGFKPDTELVVGIYRLTNEILPDPKLRIGGLHLSYLDSQGSVKTNAEGQLGFTITLDINDSPGHYEIFGSLENQEELVTWSNNSSCYHVEDKKSLPTSSPTATIDSSDTDRFDVQITMPTKDDIRSFQDLWTQVSFQDLKRPGHHIYRPRLPAEQSVIWPYTWCASENLLKENLATMHVEFRVDNLPVGSTNILEYDDPPKGGSQCHQWVTMLQNLKSGQQILLELNYVFSTPINDGWSIYPAGEYRHWIIATVE